MSQVCAASVYPVEDGPLGELKGILRAVTLSYSEIVNSLFVIVTKFDTQQSSATRHQ